MRVRHGLMGVWGAVVAVALAQSACVGGGKGLSSDEKERLKPYVLEAAPADAKKIDINFENRVHVVGYKIEPESAKPGTDVKLTYYWRCDEPVDEGWALFTHIQDVAADHTDNLDWSGPIRENKNNRQLLGPDRWEKGKIYVDEQTYKIPDGAKSPELNVMVGLWKNDARLRVVSGPSDGDNRAIIGKIKTGLTAQAEPAHTGTPALTVTKLAANEKITIDGKPDDKAWEVAASTGPFVDVGTGKPNSPFPVQGSAKLAWDDANLYVLIQVSDPDVVGGFTDAKAQPDAFTVTGQPKLWTKDTAEIMVDPDGDGDNKDYYELQINPQNKVFHSAFEGYNTPKTEPNGPFGDEKWDPKLKSAVVVRGTLDKSGDKDEGYVVEAAIPWAAFSKAANHPPKPGDTWRMNFYAMQDNGGVSWSPILGEGNFHKASRFGKVTWTTRAAAAAAGAPDAGAPKVAAAPGKDGGAGKNAGGATAAGNKAPKPVQETR
jgi:hypothetical protein